MENTTRVEQPVDNIRIEAKITGLVFNRNYSVSVEPYRQDSGQQERGIATGVTTFKTSCIGIVIDIMNKVFLNVYINNGKVTVNGQITNLKTQQSIRFQKRLCFRLFFAYILIC